MSNGETEEVLLEQPQISDEVADKLEDFGAARKLALSRTLVESTSKYLEQVREQIKGVEKFWAYSLLNHQILRHVCSAKSDVQAISYLTNVEIKQSVKDPRPFELVFHFAENPFFSNSTLSKKFSLAEGQGELDGDELIKAMKDFDNEELVESTETINWKEGQDLTKKYPRKAAEDGDFDGDLGSFFYFFTESHDLASVGSALQHDILPELYDYYLGRADNSIEDDFDDEDDELDEETGDEEEIDLEAEEDAAAKKRKRT